MEPVDGLGSLARLIRKHVRGGRVQSDSRPTAPRATDNPAPAASMAALEHELRLRLKRLQQLGAEPEVLMQTLLATLLEWEFGERLHNEPKFDALVQQVRRAIKEAPSLDDALRNLAVRLLR